MTHPIAEGVILNHHYRVIRVLGQGGFGRTYLAEDTHRFNEPCVLKEFAPQVEGSYALNKSQELFQREAGVLYRLEHPQIPRFLEMFRVNWEDRGYLFLVQEYVNGQSYRELLKSRQQKGQLFTELEVTQIFWQLLPVLDYIHSLGVIHRDISPDNLILRQSDELTVLIDFGGVKQIAATVQSEFAEASPQATRLGKQGYAPDEQMRLGIVYPHSDLYALAATALVLLTGKEPQSLIDPATLTWNWQQYTHLSPMLAGVINKMLEYSPEDRYQSSQDVINALGGETLVSPSPVAIPPAPQTVPIKPSPTVLTQPHPHSQIHRPKPTMPRFWILMLILAIGGMGWLAGHFWLPTQTPPLDTLSEAERKQILYERRQQLDIEQAFFMSLVNEVFYSRYPDQAGRTLSPDPVDAQWRKRWDVIADELLKKLETLSDPAREKLGNYSIADIQQWKQEVNALHVSSQALNDLTDGVFFHLLPEQNRGDNFIGRPLGQMWQAIASEQVTEMQTGKTLEEIRLETQTVTKTLTGTLQPGEGQVYIAKIRKGQTLKLDLEATPTTPLLSIYTPGREQPSRALIADVKENQWSGKLDDSGYYEFVIVSDSTQPLSYQLDLTLF